jgi:hypothetical protein
MTDNISKNIKSLEILIKELKKDIKYPNERNEILRKIYKIIGVTQSRPYLKSHKIDNSIDITK